MSAASPTLSRPTGTVALRKMDNIERRLELARVKP
jgi:hypothetical protein